jgi:pyruvate dehydrogenase E1 component alpha subunit/2-oxoisovalerate dehydrogenase E1 component alpha subunit
MASENFKGPVKTTGQAPATTQTATLAETATSAQTAETASRASGTAQAATTSTAAGTTTAVPPRPGKLRAGMGDVGADFVEIYSDADYARATGLWSILSADGRARSSEVPPLEPADWLAMYRGMLLIRMLDERLMTMQRQGRVGFYAEARGQEATVIAPVAALGPSDWVVPSHREGGAALCRGLPLRAYIAQVLGNIDDIGKGRQMPVHPAAPREMRFLPMSSCVATQLPQATGIAWAAKMKGDKTVVLAYLGEGATSAEDFHTGVNFAAVFKAPVVFVCVNNQWAVSTPASAQSGSETFAVKALAYGIPGVRVDGNDVFALYAAVREAIDRARLGQGPTLIEAVTYRLAAHSSSDDPDRYRSHAETEAWAAKEPLLRFGAWLRAARIFDDGQEGRMREEIERNIKDAVAATEGRPPPPLRSLIEDVYAQPPRALEEQLAELERIRGRRA